MALVLLLARSILAAQACLELFLSVTKTYFQALKSTYQSLLAELSSWVWDFRGPLHSRPPPDILIGVARSRDLSLTTIRATLVHDPCPAVSLGSSQISIYTSILSTPIYFSQTSKTSSQVAKLGASQTS